MKLNVQADGRYSGYIYGTEVSMRQRVLYGIRLRFCRSARIGWVHTCTCVAAAHLQACPSHPGMATEIQVLGCEASQLQHYGIWLVFADLLHNRVERLSRVILVSKLCLSQLAKDEQS
eukprot:6185103-Pleurochrysis_carterae.AAC.1